MPKKKSSQTFGDMLADWTMGRFKMIGTISATVVTITGAIVGYAAARDKMESWWPFTSHGYVHEQIKIAQDKTGIQIQDLLRSSRDTQLELAEGKRDATQAEVFKWQDKYDDEKDPDKKALYRDRLRDYQNTLNKQNDQVKTLTRLRAQQH